MPISAPAATNARNLLINVSPRWMFQRQSLTLERPVFIRMHKGRSNSLNLRIGFPKIDSDFRGDAVAHTSTKQSSQLNDITSLLLAAVANRPDRVARDPASASYVRRPDLPAFAVGCLQMPGNTTGHARVDPFTEPKMVCARLISTYPVPCWDGRSHLRACGNLEIRPAALSAKR